MRYMRNRIAQSGTSLLAVASLPVALGLLAIHAQPAAGAVATVNICKNSPIPAGNVIVAETNVASCTGSFPNAWTISTPFSGMNICKVSPFPDGYVITGQANVATCPGSAPSGWTIALPASGMAVCKNSPLPAGFAIVGQTNNASCPGSLPNAWVIQRV